MLRDRIVYIQTRVRQLKNLNVSKLATLDMLWDNEVKAMATQVYKMKKSNKKIKQVLAEIQKVPDNIRKIALRRYLNSCK